MQKTQFTFSQRRIFFNFKEENNISIRRLIRYNFRKYLININFQQMQGQYKVSQGLHKFITHLKGFLQSTGMTIQQFFANFQTINNNQLSPLEFYRIVSLLHMQSHSIFNPQQAFTQLSKNNVTIEIGYFLKLFQSLDHLIVQRKGNGQRSADDQIRIKIGKAGMHKLAKFMKQNKNPMELLQQFDDDNNGAINKAEFSSFLVATDIQQFHSKDIRKIVVQNIYRHFPTNLISFKQFAALFKIQEKYQPTVNIPINPIVPPPPKNIMPLKRDNSRQKKPNDPFVKKQNYPIFNKEHSREKINDPFAKKKESPFLDPRNISPQKHHIQVQKKDSFEQINNSKGNYPNAIKYYRLYDPSPSECEVMQTLEDLLTQKKTYIDKSNPSISQGAYVSSANIFNARYYLFQMAASIMMRQKSRIGIARQIQPKDIIQGQVGDCYFLSSIASVVSIYAQIIADRFLFDINPANFYGVKLFIDGEWKIIFTDDRFPCKDNRVLYAKPHNNQIWVLLLEKCWAKEFGSYKAIQAGSSKQGFTVLTGAPCELISHEKQEQQNQLIVKLEQAQANRYVATMSGSEYLQSLGKRAEQQLGLINGHAYSLLKIIKFNNETLVKLRNPWGKTVWKGNWSFSSPLWTKELRNKYNYNNNPDDGSFYMPWRDFCRYFGEVVICKINPTYMHSSIRVKTNKRKSAYIQIRVKSDGHYIVSIYQQNKRKHTNMQNYDYSQSRLIILHKKGNQYHYIGAKSCSQSQVCSVDVKLEAGDYILSAKVQWKHWPDHQLVVTSYGVDTTSFSLVNRSIAPVFKQNLIRSYALQFKGTGKVKNYDKYGFNATCETNFSIDTGIGYLHFVNNSAKGFDSTQQMNIKGIKIIKPQVLPLHFEITPKYQRIVGFFVSAGGYEYSASEKIKYY